MPDGTPPPNGRMSERIWDVATKFAVAVSIACATAVASHEIRLAKVEASRFTERDGHRLEMNLKEWISEKHPPEWLREDMTELKTMLRDVERRMSAIERNTK